MSNLDNTLDNTNNGLSNDETYVLSDETLDSMTDEEFNTYMDSGTIPEHLQELHSSSNEEPDIEQGLDEKTQPEAFEEVTEVYEETNENVKESEEQTQESEQSTEEETVEEKFDYEKAYKELFDTPIRADNTEIKLKNKEELIQLVQKGVNYTRKTQELSKDRKLVQSLKEAEIDENALNTLIDVYKGNPQAIKEFVKKYNVDVDYSFDDEDSEKNKYIPGKNIVSDLEVTMSEVVDEIKGSKYHQQVTDVITKIWDRQSVDMIMKDPSLLRGLYEEISMNRFSEIQPILAYEKLFDKNQMPDIYRYKMILDKREEEQKNTKQVPVPPPVKEKVKPVAGNKKAASIQTNTVKTEKRQLSSQDLDKMSDEDFLKYYNSNK